MIIDDEHQVAFVHIPKCGGTSVRQQLAPAESGKGFFYGRRQHADLGLVDYAHIPLSFLEARFPDAFAKLAAYRSFALVRDPHARFVSATFERMALFGGRRRTAATAREAIVEAENAIRWLEGRSAFCDAAYIHFARQIDYVALNGRKIIDYLYALEDMSGLGRDLAGYTGRPFDAARHENANFASPNRMLSILHVAKPIYGRLTTWKQREAILKLLRRWKLQAPDRLYAEFRQHRTISQFVDWYYQEDFGLHRAAMSRLACRTDTPDARRDSPSPAGFPNR